MELMETDPVYRVEMDATREKGQTRVQSVVSTPTPEGPLMLHRLINVVSTNQ